MKFKNNATSEIIEAVFGTASIGGIECKDHYIVGDKLAYNKESFERDFSPVKEEVKTKNEPITKTPSASEATV